jgi:hypothetical protein
MSVHRESMHVIFKLVGASDDERESSPEALASSICGWVLVNHLDNTLLVFDAEGSSLGEVASTNSEDSRLRWNSVPGAATPLGASLDILNWTRKHASPVGHAYRPSADKPVRSY